MKNVKLCKYCKAPKPYQEFDKPNHNYSKYCKTCVAAVQDEMSLKKCSHCGQHKARVEFDAYHRAIDKRASHCKECQKILRRPTKRKCKPTSDLTETERLERNAKATARARTPEAKLAARLRECKPRSIARRMHRGMRERCEGNYFKHGIKVMMTSDEFVEWATPLIEEFQTLYPGDKPSIDRIDPNGHYEFGNIRIISLKKNIIRSRFLHKAIGIDLDSPFEERLATAAYVVKSLSENTQITLAELFEAANNLKDDH